MATEETCPFCTLPLDRILWQSDLVIAFHDLFPVTPGHTLIITREHRPTYFDATPWEQAELWRAVGELRRQIDTEFSPQGYNVGFNASAAAGQTIMHLHVHIIPRYDSDMPDPGGGIRGVIPDKQKYTSLIAAPPDRVADSTAPYDENPFGTLPGFIPGQEAHFAGVLRKALRLADTIEIVAAFVQPSGLHEILDDLRDTLNRDARVRLLTGDYMNTTSADALCALLALRSEFPHTFEPYFFVGGGNTSFHAKAYLFSRGPHGIAFVGSSNLSRSALTNGIEWNLRTVSSANSSAFQAIRERFEALLRSPEVAPLNRELIDQYAKRAPVPSAPDPRVAPMPPHEIQKEALRSLSKLRDEGARAGLVVMATGLGKTYLSALDFQALGGERALFVAHREEILTQARDSWQRVFPNKILGLLVGGEREPDVDILFASVQTLSRQPHLRQFQPDHFDYIIIDEIHHAAANTYRKILGYFEPKFLLGLTATPDRMDGQSILDLCHDNLAYRAGLVRGIASDLLVPFRYYGVKDEIDFTNIPWRGRWLIEELTKAASTQVRAEQALREYSLRAPAGQRCTLAFCCSVSHADFMADFFRQHGVEAAAVHSGPTSAPRTESLEQLRAGKLEILCAVDVFNEGLDVPDINVVLMLRPTESPVIFLQQLGRGLRKSRTSDKPYLTIVDFIGNHRSFLVKPQALLALMGQTVSAGVALQTLRDSGLELPEGCSIDIETDVIEMLERVSRLSNDDMLVYEYGSLRDSHGRRPTAAEVHATGITVLKPVVDRYGTWFDFVDKQGDLTDGERRVLQRHKSWFADLHTTKMARSYRMVTLKALLERDSLRSPCPITDLVHQAYRIMSDDILLREELAEAREVEDPERRLQQIWREQPLKVWTEGKSTSRKWFALQEDQFRFLEDVDEADSELFDEMTAELVDLRLAAHRDKLRSTVSDPLAPIRIRVSHSGGNPILRYDRERRPDIPAADTEVPVLVDGERHLFRFRRIAVNVVSSEAGGPNQLPTLMRRWFGPNAGQPGTHHFVLLSHQGSRWVLTPDLVEESPRRAVVLAFPQLAHYPDLKVACGTLESGRPGDDRAERVQVRTDIDLDPSRHFVVTASGDSMSGGPAPIEDGDLVLCEWIEATTLEQIEGLPCLLTGGTGTSDRFAVLKIPVRRGAEWLLRSTRPGIEDDPVPSGLTLRPVARALEVVEELPGPDIWGKYDRSSAVALFGLQADRSWQVGHRDIVIDGQGHSVFFVTLRKGADTPATQRYADRFISPGEFQWESQASTKPEAKKGRDIIEQQSNGRIIHLFCRYEKKDKFTYCGTLRYRRHHGSQPIRIWFELDHPLPENLWRLWET